MMKPNSIASDIDALDPADYAALAEDTFESIEHFVLNLVPLLWSQETTVLQAKLTSLVLVRQLRRRPVTVASIAAETGHARSTVQNSVDRLIDQGWLISETDPEDGRQKLLRIAPGRVAEVGALEHLLVQARLSAFRRLQEKLSDD